MSEKTARKPKSVRKWRFPWEPVPGDDGYLWSLRMARFCCGVLMLLPVLFGAMAAAVIVVVGDPHEEPVITAALAVISLAILPAAPFVRERIASVGISAHLAGDKALRRPRSVYAGFATATITGYIVAQVGALFGFISTALSRDPTALIVGSVFTYAVWALMWPRDTLWQRWTWQARLRRDDEA